MCVSQGTDDLSYRRRLRRGETVDGCDFCVHPPENSHTFNQAKSLNRSHTIHQDMTHSSPKDLEHTQCSSISDKMADSEENDHFFNLSSEQVVEKSDENMQASLNKEKETQGEKEEEEEDQNKGKDVHWVSTAMDNIVLWGLQKLL